MENLKRAILTSDGSGHDYLIPYDLDEHFASRLEEAEQTEYEASCTDTYTEGAYTFDDFDEEFELYRVEGDYEIYAEFND